MSGDVKTVVNLDELRKEFNDDFGLLIEAGFVAVKQLDEKTARYLFTAAQEIRPESVTPKIGFGYIALNKLEAKVAEKIFLEVVAKEPENSLAQTLLGVAELLQKEKRAQGEKRIQDSMKSTEDESVKDLGRLALEWSEKDLKKTGLFDLEKK